MVSKVKEKNWYQSWWAIVLFVFIGLVILGNLFGNDSSTSNNNVYSNNQESEVQNDNCVPDWQCTSWSECSEFDRQTRTCSDKNDCGISSEKPQMSQSCKYIITETKTPAVEEELDTATMGEKNALSEALSYLRYTSFSYSGLIEQLEYEGYGYEEAKYGVDNCKADWNEQAALNAQSYLDYSAFSRAGLIEQLEYEGFTKKQAEYGVEAVGY